MWLYVFSIKSKLNFSLVFFPGNPGGRGAFCLGNPDRRGGSCASGNPGERGGLKSDPIRRGGVWIFSGITHFTKRTQECIILEQIMKTKKTLAVIKCCHLFQKVIPCLNWRERYKTIAEKEACPKQSNRRIQTHRIAHLLQTWSSMSNIPAST